MRIPTNRFAPGATTLAVLAALAVSGCGGGKSSQFYRLSVAEAPSHSDAVLGPRAVVLVDPLVVAEYVRRPQIVTVVDAYEYDLQEYHRWAEPLERSIESVMRDNLRARLGTPAVLMGLYVRPSEADYRLSISIERFDMDAAGHCVLEATWAFGRGGDPVHQMAQTVESRRFERTPEEEPEKGDYSTRVAAMSGLLGELSDAITETVRAYMGTR
jgi:uncharacterized lipoprotein YmbA